MRSKYGNKKTVLLGIGFDSRKEAKYYLYLRQRIEQGEIEDLRMQVPYEIIPSVYEDETVQLKTKTKTVRRCVQKAVHYVADFVYLDKATGKEVVVDTKGFRTEAYKLKKKLMRALRGIDIVEV